MPQKSCFTLCTLILFQAWLATQASQAWAQPKSENIAEDAEGTPSREPANQRPVRHTATNSNSKPYPQVGLVISGLLGFDLVDSGTQSAGNPGFGITVGYCFSPTWTLGVSVSLVNSNPDDVATAGGATSSIALFTGMIDYHFRGLESLYFGARVGTGLRTSTFSTPLAGSATTYSLAYGGVAGWNFQILDTFALSPQVGYERIDTPVATSDIAIQLAIRYWPGVF